MAKIEKYLEDGQGRPSSKRLMSWRMLWFFMIFNSLVWPLLIWFSIGQSEQVVNGVVVSQHLDLNWILALISFDFLVLVATFVPTQLSKITEMKEIVGLSKNK